MPPLVAEGAMRHVGVAAPSRKMSNPALVFAAWMHKPTGTVDAR